nr:hypothetical protein [Tanacetum cinerariifolium]
MSKKKSITDPLALVAQNRNSSSKKGKEHVYETATENGKKSGMDMEHKKAIDVLSILFKYLPQGEAGHPGDDFKYRIKCSRLGIFFEGYLQKETSSLSADSSSIVDVLTGTFNWNIGNNSRVENVFEPNNANNNGTNNVANNVVGEDNLPQLLNSRGSSHVTNVPQLDVEDFISWKDRKLANQDKRLKSIIISCLPNGTMKIVIKCSTARDMWNDLILSHKRPSEIRYTKIAALRLKYNALKVIE